MSNLESGQNGQSVDACLHQGRRVGSHVGEGGQQGYHGHWGLGGQQQAEWQDRATLRE